jgi:flavin-dependent dehydrogenase
MMGNITIIGGSAAGFYTAYLLARQNSEVTLFEASDRIDPSPRTLIATHHMREVLGPFSEGAVVNTINRFDLYADGRVATVALGKPDLVVERSRLIRVLAEKAEAAGAQILTGRRFLGLKPDEKGLHLALSHDGSRGPFKVSTGMVVGADGAFSKVARDAGWPSQDTVSLIQALVDLPEDASPSTARVWFIPEHTPYFFWLIPHSPTRGVIGLIGKGEGETRRALAGFLEKKGLEPIEFQSALIPVYKRWIPNHRVVGAGHVYLVGDAASHVKVTTMGGLVTGFRGSLGVAEAILNGGSSRELRVLRRELDRHRLIRRVLHRFVQSDYARLLCLLTPSATRTLSLFNRDVSGKLLLRVLCAQPRLLLLGLRSLLNGG